MKTVIKQTFLALAISAAAIPAYAAPRDPELVALDAKLPGDLVNDPRGLADFTQNGATATSKVIKSANIPGGEAALQVDIANQPDQPWKISANMRIIQPIARGDVVTVGFYAKALPGKDGKAAGVASVRIQQNVSPWTGFLDKPVNIGSEWQWYEVAGVANTPIEAANGSLMIMLGGKAQSVQIGQIIVVKGANAIASTTAQPVVVLPPVLQTIQGKLINQPEAGPWNTFGSAGTLTKITDKGVYSGKASRFSVDKADSKPWEFATSIPIDSEIKQGDRLQIAMAVRTVSASTTDGKGSVPIRVMLNKEPWPGFAENTLHPGVNWQLLQLRTTATMDIPAGQAAFTMSFGGAKQVVDVGPVYIFKLDQ